MLENRRILEANAAALCRDLVALVEILQDEVDRLPGQSDEVRDVSLAQPERDDDPISVLHALPTSEMEQGVGHARTGALVKSLANAARYTRTRSLSSVMISWASAGEACIRPWKLVREMVQIVESS